MATSVFGITTGSTQAGDLITRLKNSGFMDNDISLLMPDKGGSRDMAHEMHTKAPEGATAGVSAGGVLGGAVGLLAGIGALAIPGVGPLIAAGPILAALSGAAVGAAVGGVGGALIGMGIPEYEAKRYEGKVAAGNVLISVHADNAEEERRARDILTQGGATDIHVASEATPEVRVPDRTTTRI